VSESNKKSYSRRNFIKNVTTGMIGTSVAIGTLKDAKAQTGEEIKEEVPLKDHEKLSFNLNGRDVQVFIPPNTSLAELLRNHFELTGTKIVCNHGECGGCTVVVDKKAVYSCQMLAMDVEGKEVVTIEGLLDGENLHPLQQAFVDKDGLQCGFCTPGQIMAAYALLLENPKPDRETVIDGMSGNICRCSAYPKIIDSVLEATKRMNG
jgi:aerobic-type carbon monoxide dehydrogenase small subunit (CoxS/CutS family)